MALKYKTIELKLKDEDTGLVAGFFSTYDEEPDSYGDIVAPGAFTETIKKRKESGHPFPLCFNHDFSAIIGAIDMETIEDTKKGPYFEGHLLDTELAQDVRKMLKTGAVYQFSFAYEVLGWEEPTKEQRAKGIWNVLTKLEVFEISVVTVPANQNAVVTEVKSGKRNSKADEDIIRDSIRELGQTVEDLNEAIASINTRIQALRSLLDEGAEDNPDEGNADNEKAAPEGNAPAEDQTGACNSAKAAHLLDIIKNMTKET